MVNTLRVADCQMLAKSVVAGRSPGLRVKALSGLPSHQMASGMCRRRSPLTVAGAATVLIPDGYVAPCSLFSRFPLGIAAPTLSR